MGSRIFKAQVLVFKSSHYKESDDTVHPYGRPVLKLTLLYCFFPPDTVPLKKYHFADYWHHRQNKSFSIGILPPRKLLVSPFINFIKQIKYCRHCCVSIIFKFFVETVLGLSHKKQNLQQVWKYCKERSYFIMIGDINYDFLWYGMMSKSLISNSPDKTESIQLFSSSKMQKQCVVKTLVHSHCFHRVSSSQVLLNKCIW